MQQRIQVLFICMGNICRSPSAQAVVRSLADRAGLGERVVVDSAGTHATYHLGDPPDPRAMRHAAGRGYDLSGLRARRVTEDDFERFDLIIAMDWDNLERLEELCPPDHRGKLRRMMEFATEIDSDVVPDPYYGGPAGFERVLDCLEDAGAGLVGELARRIAHDAAELPE